MYKPNKANTTSGYSYGGPPAQSAPNYGAPGHYPGSPPQNRAATAPTQTPPNNSAPQQMPAPVNGSPAQPGMQPQRGPAPAPTKFQMPQQPHQQASNQRSGTSGYHQGMPNYNHGSSAPQLQPQPAPPPIQFPNQQRNPAPYPAPYLEHDSEPDINPGEYVSSKITQINAKDKVVDFSSKLIKAKVKDFANIHGRGGKDHANNSTIAITICDFTKGTGEGKSVTASYNMDVAVVDRLYNAALKADLDEIGPSYSNLAASVAIALRDLQRWEQAGQQPVSIVPFRELTDTGTALGNAVKANNPSAISTASEHTLIDLRRWAANRKQCPSAGVPLREIFDLKNTLAAALSTEGKPLYEYVSEKNVPYPDYRDAEGRYPCSKLCITYTPIRRGGEKSRYPWFIQIENFRAPLVTKSNGASSHDASKAVDRRTVCIHASTSDFLDCMVEVKRYIRIWEIVEAIPIVRKGLRWLEKVRAEKKSKSEKKSNKEKK